MQIGGVTGAPGLLLLQGQANSHVWWDGLREGFESEFQTITMDYRGTGASRGPVGSWSMESFAADAADILDSAGIADAFVYGTSMGGRVVQMLVVRHPDRVKALVLACTTPGGPNTVARSREVSDDLPELLRLTGSTSCTICSTPRWRTPVFLLTGFRVRSCRSIPGAGTDSSRSSHHGSLRP
ncbi:alpha/beta fold hydrolase [Arthrobacter sp. PsM3]|uniref:alpha/beta fold hydrolase n=1 Tax=Arthrobacter sp. PsM3 TaxID=3030531 RepID=UPI00263A8CCF|nr:alpha/beta fold hydrolase [Arthrobacter sp. PsM3]MDN4645900.1 alpha/beta fold hydrolase [Arthrobacter sp. PsM3]